MNIRRIAASFVVGVVLTVGIAAPSSSAFAQKVATGDPYGCQINPNAAACQKTTTPAVVNGSVASVSGTSGNPGTLPVTGGGSSSGENGTLLALVTGTLLSLGGFALRRRITSTA